MDYNLSNDQNIVLIEKYLDDLEYDRKICCGKDDRDLLFNRVGVLICEKEDAKLEEYLAIVNDDSNRLEHIMYQLYEAGVVKIEEKENGKSDINALITKKEFLDKFSNRDNIIHLISRHESKSKIAEKNKKKLEKKEKILSNFCKWYEFPVQELISKLPKGLDENNKKCKQLAERMQLILFKYNIKANVIECKIGPRYTCFFVKPELGTKINDIKALSDEIIMHIDEPNKGIEFTEIIPGKGAMGIYLVNDEAKTLPLWQMLNEDEYANSNSELIFPLGINKDGKNVYVDLEKTSHVLIGGTTNSGKSVLLHSIILSLLFKSRPEDVKLLLVDSKGVEFNGYESFPHMLVPPINNIKKATSAINWLNNEIFRRNKLFAEKGIQNITQYNEFNTEKLPYIVLIIDEFADIASVSNGEASKALSNVLKSGYRFGINVILSTQRPSVGLIGAGIKTNIQTKISFATSSGMDSKIILDETGAEKLLGAGDLLYTNFQNRTPSRVQSVYVSSDEINSVCTKMREKAKEFGIDNEFFESKNCIISETSSSNYDPNEKDDLYYEAGKLIIEQDNASIGLVQRRFRIGFNRSAHIIDQLEATGVISKQNGKEPRRVLMTLSEFEEVC